MAALRQMAAAHAQVIRDGERRSVDATRSRARRHHPDRGRRHDPGRCTGDSAAALQTAEASLTGESLPVTKDVAPIAGEMATRRPRQHGVQRDDGDLRPRTGDRRGHGDADRNGAHCRDAPGSPRRANAAPEGARPRRQSAGSRGGRDRRRDDRHDPARRERQRASRPSSTCSSSAWPSRWPRCRKGCRRS